VGWFATICCATCQPIASECQDNSRDVGVQWEERVADCQTGVLLNMCDDDVAVSMGAPAGWFSSLCPDSCGLCASICVDVDPVTWPEAAKPLANFGGCGLVPTVAAVGITCKTDLAFEPRVQELARGVVGTLCDYCPSTCGGVDVCGATCGNGAVAQCFTVSSKYEPLDDVEGHVRSREDSVASCQARCAAAAEAGCAFFSFWNDGVCCLSSATATRVAGSAGENVQSGPATCGASVGSSPSPGPSPSLSPSPSSSSIWTHEVDLSATLMGVTMSIARTPSFQAAFKDGIAEQYSTSSRSVVLGRIVATRRRLADGVHIPFTIQTSSLASAEIMSRVEVDQSTLVTTVQARYAVHADIASRSANPLAAMEITVEETSQQKDDTLSGATRVSAGTAAAVALLLASCYV